MSVAQGWPYPDVATVRFTPEPVMLTPAGTVVSVAVVNENTGRMYEFVETVETEDGRMDKWQLIETDKEPGGGSA